MKKLSLIAALIVSLAVVLPASFCFSAPKPAQQAEQVKTEVININTADEVELSKLPGIGLVKAQQILAYREKIGNFKNVEDLLQVKGIGEKSLKKLRPYITL